MRSHHHRADNLYVEDDINFIDEGEPSEGEMELEKAIVTINVYPLPQLSRRHPSSGLFQRTGQQLEALSVIKL